MTWSSVTCGEGHSHRLFSQQKEESCGMACVAMVIQRKLNQEKTEAEIRKASQALGSGAYRPSPKDAGAPTADPRLAMMAAVVSTMGKGGYTGTMATNLAPLLQGFGVPAAVCYHESDPKKLKKALKKAKAASPIIALVRWEGDTGGHFVVVDRFIKHYFKRSQICVNDPIYGVNTINFPTEDVDMTSDPSAPSAMHAPKYEPKAGVVGAFNGWLITT